MEYLKRYFSIEISTRVIGVTPEFDGLAARGREIMHIVNTYQIKNWIVLDDDPRLFDVDFQNIIYTEGHTGITDAHLEPLAKHFRSWKTA
ncbi:HAD domain-containing protein [Curvibacter lanceolatus]|uniref:HAD domain-containing protein n=1 Tax=Curvibacter lanceolatus TaxID=86182 RepID=UPI00146D7095|nr:HAD domain-containing protein [Curvibacter lanceolatus]